MNIFLPPKPNVGLNSGMYFRKYQGYTRTSLPNMFMYYCLVVSYIYLLEWSYIYFIQWTIVL